MSEMVKYVEENCKLNQINSEWRNTEEKVKMVKKPEDAENVQEFEKIITSNKKNSLVNVPSRYNILHFKEAFENNSRNLQTKSL